MVRRNRRSLNAVVGGRLRASDVVPTANGLNTAKGESAEGTSAGAIGRNAARGGLLLILRNIVLQCVQVVSSIILARAITPNDYGALAVAATLVGLARSIGDLGLSESLVVRADFRERDLSTTSLVVMSSTVVVGILVAVCGVLARGRLLSGSGPPLLAGAYAGTLIIDALRLGPIVRIMRGLRFKDIAVASTAESVATNVALVLLLLLGFGLWGVVLAQYARAVTGAYFYRRLGGPFARPKRGGGRGLVRDALPFQGPIILSGVVGALLPLIVAGYLDARGLGLWAWSTILAVPLTTAMITIQSVLLPSLARLYGQHEQRFAEAANRSARLIALTAGAGSGAIVGLAPAIIRQIFGSRWAGATGAVQVTLLGLLPLMMSLFLATAMQSRRRAVPRFRCALIASCVTLIVVYPLMLADGVTGAALASAVIGPAVDMLLLARVAAIPLGRASLDGLVALAMAGALSSFLGPEVHSIPQLAATAVVTGAAVPLIMWIIDRPVLRYAWKLLRSRDGEGVATPG
jgi:O-antigen/teichoic acid export membrane protein